MSPAEEVMRRMNPHGLTGEDEDGAIVMIEDHADPDGRMYRMEYRSSPDGKHTVAYCRYNPWGVKGRPNAGAGYATGHVAEDGFLCLGAKHSGRKIADSPYDVAYAIRRARFWCTAFSVLKETGTFPQPMT